MIRAFLVDDEPLALNRLTRLLTATGRVEVAGSSCDPVEAIEYLRTHTIDILFTDIQMPGLSGFQMLAKLDSPPFVMFRYENWLYPYTMRTQLGTTARAEAWRVIHLENEFLACSVLPDLGGHLYRCIDKANGHDVFHPALSIKKASVAPRGSWISTGIEFNFPVGHSWDTVSPVDFSYRQNDDGSASVFVGDIDRISGMQWLMSNAFLRQR